MGHTPQTHIAYKIQSQIFLSVTILPLKNNNLRGSLSQLLHSCCMHECINLHECLAVAYQVGFVHWLVELAQYCKWKERTMVNNKCSLQQLYILHTHTHTFRFRADTCPSSQTQPQSRLNLSSPHKNRLPCSCARPQLTPLYLWGYFLPRGIRESHEQVSGALKCPLHIQQSCSLKIIIRSCCRTWMRVSVGRELINSYAFAAKC